MSAGSAENQLTTASVVGVVANVATAIGLGWAVFLFRREQQRLRRERETATHTELNNRYLEYLKLCFDHPDLWLHDYGSSAGVTFSAEQERQRIVAFEMLVSLFELAFVMYEGHTDEFRRLQWRGWERYIGDWSKRPDFLSAWDVHLGSQYDSRFMKYMSGEMASARAALRAGVRSPTTAR